MARKTGEKDEKVGETIKAGWFARKFNIYSNGETGNFFTFNVFRNKESVPNRAIGIYLRVLYALQLDDDILLLAKEDTMGKALQDLSLKKRERASKKE